MASPSSQTLIKRSQDTELMPPPPPPKRIKRPPKVLDEDDYTDSLSHIIARDFFPGLLETQTQQNYLDALNSKDKEWIANAGRRLEEVMTPSQSNSGRRGVSMTPRMTPRAANAGINAATPREWAGDTPVSVASATPGSSVSTATTRRPESAVPDVESISLGAFQAKYTSEDNESFNKVLDKQNAKRRENYAWMWNDNKVPTARQIAYRKREAKRLEGQRRRPGGEEGDTGKQLVIADQGGENDSRPAKPDSWESKPENPLMFIPSSVEDTHQTLQQKAEEASHAGPKHVVYQNTRIQPPQDSDDTKSSSSSSIPPPSPSISAVRDAIAGRPRPTDSESGFTGGETPRVGGYAFVDEDEPPAEQAAEDDDQAYHLSLLASQSGSSSGGSNPFKLQETRKREALHHRMVERVARNKRTEKVAQGTKTPVPRFTSSPMMSPGRTPGSGSGSTPSAAGSSKASLTPAAQRLWANIGTPKRSTGEGSRLKNAWTPTPKRAK